MCDIRVRNADRLCRLGAAAVLLAVLLIPAEAMAQQPNERGSDRRFAVGGGVLYGTVICYNCDDPGTLGASGGFQVRLNENWSFVAEGAWSGGYEAFGFSEEGVRYPGLRHDYFAFLELKMRWEFSEMRHRPYLVFGGAGSWDHDTLYSYGRSVNGRWVLDLDNPQVREELNQTGGVIFGFGWAFKVGDRVEIRPEASLYMGGFVFTRVGVTGWFNF